MAGRRPAERSGRRQSGVSALREVKSSLPGGWRAGLTVLSGDDLFHLDAARDALLSHLVPENSHDFALTVCGDSRVAVAEVIAAARSRPMFAVRRVVVVRDASCLEGDEAPVVAYAGSPPEYSFLIVRAPKLDLRRALHKALATAGLFFEFGIVEAGGAEGVQAVTDLAAARRLRIERTAAAFLLEGSAGDYYRVSSELDKIASFLATEGPRLVTMDVVREVGAVGGVFRVWAVTDAILARDTARAIAGLRQVLDAGDAPLQVLGALAWRTRAIVQARAMVEGGAGWQEVFGSTRVYGEKDKEALRAAVGKYSLAEVVAFPARLLQADRTLKSRALDPRSVLETLVSDLTRPAGSAHEEAP